MALTAEQIEKRGDRLTASRVGVLMQGDPAKVLALWEEMTGQREPEDLSHVWAVQLGSHTESLNLDWYEIKTGAKLIRRGDVSISPIADWAAATLDGFDPNIPGPIECKHVGGFESRDTVIARYMPQIHWQMLCTNTKAAAFSIIEGAREPVIEPVVFDADYAKELWSRAEAFMQCVNDLTPPVELAPVDPPKKIETFRTVSMQGSNAWAEHAADWLENQKAAKKFETAAKEIKALVEADVGLASGHGIAVSRNKAGSLTIKRD